MYSALSDDSPLPEGAGMLSQIPGAKNSFKRANPTKHTTDKNKYIVPQFAIHQ